MAFQGYYEQIAKPFEWKFTREDLTAMLNTGHFAVPPRRMRPEGLRHFGLRTRTLEHSLAGPQLASPPTLAR